MKCQNDVFLQVWPHKEYPLIPVGRMVLNRNPINYFAEVEQLAFDPSNMPPGIEASPDKMLQVTPKLTAWSPHPPNSQRPRT